MLKIIKEVEGGYEVLDTEDSAVEIATAEELVLAISEGVVFDNCEYGPKGLVITLDGQEPVDVDVEVWKPVWFERSGAVVRTDMYEVSNLGRVRSIHFTGRYKNKVVYLRNSRTKEGYRRLELHCDKKTYRVRIHRLVAYAFLVNPTNLPVVNHKDEIPGNDWASNLEWCTVQYNVSYGSAIQKRAEALNKAIRQYSFSGKLLAEYVSILQASQVLGINYGCVAQACRREIQTAVGFAWRFVSDDELFDLSENARASALSSCQRSSHIVRQYSLDGKFIAEYPGVIKAAVVVGVYRNAISRCCNRYIDRSRGYIWRYACDDEFAERPENKAAIEAFHESSR